MILYDPPHTVHAEQHSSTARVDLLDTLSVPERSALLYLMRFAPVRRRRGCQAGQVDSCLLESTKQYSTVLHV